MNQLKFASNMILLNCDLHVDTRAYEVAQEMDDDSIIEKLRHIGKSGGRNDSKERQIDSFYHI